MENKAKSGTQFLVENIFNAAANDPVLLEQLNKNPATVFRNAGLSIPENMSKEFNEFYATQAQSKLRSAVDQDQELLTAWPSLACSACSIGAWSVAVLIVAVGAAGLATLSATSAPVVALAAWAGVSSAAALAFIVTLGTAVTKGVGAVVEALCEWTGACP